VKLLEYFNREGATVSILRDFNDQAWKLENDAQRISELDSEMTAVRGAALSPTPVQGGGTRMEDMLVNTIDKKAVYEHGYKQAEEYHRELLPAWERLTDAERFMLKARYVNNDEYNGISAIMEYYHISRTEAYNRSNKALRRLTKLLFW